MSGFKQIKGWIDANAQDLALDADNPAQFTWELEQLRAGWTRTFNDRLRIESAWTFFERHPGVLARAVAADLPRTPDGAESPNGEDELGVVDPSTSAPPNMEDAYPAAEAARHLPVHVPRPPVGPRPDVILGIATLFLIAGVVVLAIVAALGRFDGVSPFFATLTALTGVLVGYYLGRKSRGG